MKKCYNCEREFEELIEVEGEYYCDDCIDELCIGYCEDCETYHHENNLYFIDEHCVCRDCVEYSGNYFQCHDCGEYHTSDEAHDCYNGDYYVCSYCVERNYTYVECCDTYVSQDDAYYDDYEEVYLCSHCHNNDIYDYHEFSNWQTQKLENENPPFYIGFELEIENTKRDYDNSSLARFVKNSYPVICSRDGSIDYGFEIVSHPLSYNYIVENQDKLKTMLNGLGEKGCESHNPGTCGLHFHVTHPHNDDIIDRIILIMETYKQELIAFSRRTSSQIDSWCKFLSDIKEESDCKSLYFIKKNKETSSRYMALNLTNYNTIEFRLFRGTLNFDTFMASVELVNNIVTLCSDLNIPVSDITWDRLTETQYAHTYCDVKNIHTTLIPHSNDEYYIERERKEQQCRENIVKIIEEIRPLIQHNMISNDILTASNMNELDERMYYYTRTMSNIREFINILKTIIYLCGNDTAIDTIINKLELSRLYIPQLNSYDSIVSIIVKLIKESKILLGKESE